MSFDIIILKPEVRGIGSLEDIENTENIGAPTVVEGALEKIFPGCIRGAFSDGESYALEAMYSGDPVESIHMTLRYGSVWSATAESSFVVKLRDLCMALDSQAFAVSDNSRIEY